MRLKTFDAATMQDAMQRIKSALGDQAVILSATKAVNGKGVRVTAAVEEHYLPPAAPFVEASAPDSFMPTTPPPAPTPQRVSVQELRGLEKLWSFHGVGEAVAARMRQNAHFLQYLSEDDLLPDLLARIYRFEPMRLLPRETVMLVGPPAMGKTLAAAKIAAHAAMRRQPVSVVTTDAKRAGGVEQLKAFTDILDVPLHVAEDAAELSVTLAGLPEEHLLVIDTAGVNIFDDKEKRQLGQYVALVGVPPVLALAAGLDAGESQDIARTFAGLGADRLLVTRTDGARRFGGILCAAATCDLALAHHTHSARVAAGLDALDAHALARLLAGEIPQEGER